MTIGIPVFNGAATLAQAADSALRQTYPNCAIILSDNASSDATQSIAQALARDHANVISIRHAENIGISGNFLFVLEQARSPYFMWLAADDTIEPSYVEQTLAALEANPDWVACGSRTRFVKADGQSRIVQSTPPLADHAPISTDTTTPRSSER